MTNTRFAVDSNFLMHLARSREVALDALDVIRRRARGLKILVVPAVFDELAHKAENDPNPEIRALTRKAITGMKAWDAFLAELADPQDSIAHSIANKLLVQGVIPWEERNDALILAQAAVLGCQMLITSDSDLCDADRAQLARVLWECDVSEVVVRTPVEIVRDFGGR